jgi:hypothetical protein
MEEPAAEHLQLLEEWFGERPAHLCPAVEWADAQPPCTPSSLLYSPTGWMLGLGPRNPRHNASWETLPEELQVKIVDQLPLLPVRTVRARGISKLFAKRLKHHFELLQCHDTDRFARYVVRYLIASPDKVTTEMYSAIHSTVCRSMSTKNDRWIHSKSGNGDLLDAEIKCEADAICRAVIETLDAELPRTMPLATAKQCLNRVRNLFCRADELRGTASLSIPNKCEAILASVQAKAGLLERALR